MRKIWPILVLLFPFLVRAQVAVTATVVDPNGVPYSNGSARAVLVDANGIDLTNVVVNVNGASIALPAQSKGLSSTGSMSFSLYPNTQISYTSATSWKFSICSPPSATGSINPPQTCFSSTISISGATDISATLKAASVALVGSLSGGLKFPDGTVQYTANNSGTVSGQASGVIPLPSAANAITLQSHLDDGVTTSATLTASEPFVAPSVNTVLDLKGKFGASGSQQTMSCTTIANAAALSSCTGGDFKSGQWVFIPGAGGTPTISAPGAPTLSCHVDNGAAACNTGSVVYGYKIVALQAMPNGAMTAASTATTITQTAQSPQAPGGSNRPDTYTTVSWSAVASASGYLIYKSIAGGAYNFYTIFPSGSTVTFNDYGFWSASIFTCTDMGVPCTAPSSATPNDVYATLTANGAGSWTLSALPFPPKYMSGASLNGSTTYPSTPATSGTFTVQHDDTQALPTARAYMVTNGGANFNLHIPSGTFNFHAEDPYGRAGSAMHLQGLNNFTLDGNGKATQLYMANDRAQVQSSFLEGVCGFSTQNPPSSCLTMGSTVGGGTVYALTDPVSLGTYSVTLSTPANASNFPAGTYVTIGTSAAGYPQEDYAEMNLVASSNASTGLVTLVYPINKPYSATLPVPYNNCSACQGSPQMGPVLPNPVATNITLKNFWFRGAVTFLNTNAIDGFNIENIDATVAFGEGEGFIRHRKIQGNHIVVDNFGIGTGFLGVSAQSSGDYLITGNLFEGSSAEDDQPCSEGGTNQKTSHNHYIYHGIQDTGNGPSSIIGGGGQCYGYAYTDNLVELSNGNLRAIIGTTDNHGISTISNNAFFIDSAGTTAQSSTVLCLSAQAQSSGVAGQAFNNLWSIGNLGKCGAKTSNNASQLQTVDEPTLSATSGGLILYDQYGGFSIMDIGPLTGNITSVNLGSAPHGGLFFWLAFIQASSGGPYTLPADCLNSHWGASGSGIDCPNGPPVINPAASSKTYLAFYDDGTTIHFLASSYASPLPVTIYSAAGTALPACNSANAGIAPKFVSDAPAGSLTPGTAYAAGGGTIKVYEQCAYSGSAYAWQSM